MKTIYRNNLNYIPMTNYSRIELNVYFLACTLMKERESNTLLLNYTETKKYLDLENQRDDYITDILLQTSKRLIFPIEVKDDEGYISIFSLFEFRINPEKKLFEIIVNKKFKSILNDFNDGHFTMFEFEQYAKLDSKYSKNLYRLLKQYRRTGICNEYSKNIEQLKILLDAPANCETKYFVRKCINIAIKELQDNEYFKNLKVIPTYGFGRGKPIIGYRFTFKAEEIDNDSSVNKSGTKAKVKPNPNNRFNNFDGRDYSSSDYADMERMFANNN